jgi:hypothetical protein
LTTRTQGLALMRRQEGEQSPLQFAVAATQGTLRIW